MRCPICNEEVSDTEEAQRWGPEFAHARCATAYNFGKMDNYPEAPKAAGEPVAWVRNGSFGAKDFHADSSHPNETWPSNGRIWEPLYLHPSTTPPAQASDAENAARYLWLKQAWTVTLLDGSVQMSSARGIRCRSIAEIDAAIDAARKGEQP